MKWADLIEDKPTLSVGQADDLKVDTGTLRVWLSRTGIEDGTPFERTVYVEEYDGQQWYDVGYFDGDEDDPQPWPQVMADAYEASQ